MEQLRELLKSMSRGEIEILKSSMKSFASGQAKPEKRSIKLIEFLLKSEGELPADVKIAKKIYGSDTSARSAMSMLKMRVKDKVMDSILADVNIERAGNIDIADLALIRARKKLAQFQYLYYSKGSLRSTLGLLDEVVDLGKEFELYSSLVEALKYKKWTGGLSRGEQEFTKQSKEVEFYDRCNKAVNRAADLYYLLIMKGDFSGNKDLKKAQEFMQKSIEEMRKDFLETQSPVVEYYLKRMEFVLFESKKNYLKARSICLDLINIVRNKKSVFRKQRIGIAYEYISACETHLSNFKQAIEYAQLAQNNINPGSFNFLIAQEFEIFPLIYSRSYKRASELLKDMLKSDNCQAGSFRYAKYRFCLANILFMEGKFKEALRILSENLDLSSDKTGWDISVRVLAIICNIELEKYEKATLLVDNLRKHAEYNSKNQNLKERDVRIIKALQHLQNNGFRFNKNDAKLVANTDLLRSKKDCPWEAYSPELIPFNEWLDKHYHLKRTAEKVLVEGE